MLYYIRNLLRPIIISKVNFDKLFIYLVLLVLFSYFDLYIYIKGLLAYFLRTVLTIFLVLKVEDSTNMRVFCSTNIFHRATYNKKRKAFYEIIFYYILFIKELRLNNMYISYKTLQIIFLTATIYIFLVCGAF